MATSTNLSKIESKKQEGQRGYGYGEHFNDCQMRESCGVMGKEVRELRNTKW